MRLRQHWLSAVGIAALLGGLDIGAAVAATDEIIVTARKREESLQDIPISGVALSSDFIENFALDSIADFVDLIPGVRISGGGNAEVSQDVTVRGVGVARLDSSAAATGIFRNGIFIGNGSFFGRAFTRFDTFDLERFEVFRGPQGALWGRNAAGGAINIVTAKPKFEHEGHVKLSYEVEQDARYAELVENIPLNDKVAVRLGGVFDDRKGGIIEIDDPASPKDGDKVDEAYFGGVRVSVRVQPADFIDINLSAEHAEEINASYSYVMHKPLRGDPGKFLRRCGNPIMGVTCSFNENENQYDVESSNVFGSADIDLGWAALDLIGVYTARTGKNRDDFDAFAYPGLLTSPTNNNPRVGDFERTGLEAVLKSTETSRWSWLVGADMQNSTDTYFSDFYFDTYVAGMLAATTESRQRSKRALESWSVFGAVDVDLTDRLALGGELRYIENHMENFTRQETAIVSFVGPSPAPTAFLARPDIDEHKTTPVVTLTYEVVDGHKVYGRYATGFRPGGFEPRQVSGQFFPNYEAEDITAYEVGYKGNALQNVIQYDLAAYYMDHTDVQITDLFVNNVGAIVSRVGNGGDAWSAGFEANLRSSFALGPGRAQVGAGYAYTTGEIEEGSNAGNRTPETRDYFVTLHGGYIAPIPNHNASWFTNLSFIAQGGGYQNPQNTIDLNNFERLDGSLGVSNEEWRLQLFARNILNELYPATEISLFGQPIFLYNQARTYGVELTYSW